MGCNAGRRSLSPIALMLAWMLLPVGCSNPDVAEPAAPLHAVKGKVKLDGPGSLAGLRVVFVPATPSGRIAMGDLEADGSYALKTGDLGQGIAEGEYRVRLEPGGGAAPKKGSKGAATALPSKYSDEDASGLTATIKPDTTEIPDLVVDTHKEKAGHASKRGD